ncbi:MAG: 2-oxoacid:acceptor oxidoreductase family protein [Candidatus Magasanikbacteria bacterium]|nr:2-oxoacid:acceptor oxidoreductase family protein [Candidatus Magasanikbacteria bacterium]
MLKNEILKILLAGDGGQGIQLLSDIICRSAIDQGLQAASIPNYGLEQRGGVSLSFVQVGIKEIIYPKFTKPNILLIMSEQARARVKQHQFAETKIIDIVDFKIKMDEVGVSAKSQNIFFLGMLTKMLAAMDFCNQATVLKLLEKKLGAKLDWEENKKAFEQGLLCAA